MIIGILLIVTGIFMMQHQSVSARADKKAREHGGEIICGNARGLLFLTSSYIWIRADEKGNLGKAWVVRSGIISPARTYEYDLQGENIRTLDVMELANEKGFPSFAVSACRSAKQNFETFCVATGTL